jgi:hypothetical protein
MRLIAAIEDPAVAERILECLKLPARAPPLGRVTAESEEPDRVGGRLVLRPGTDSRRRLAPAPAPRAPTCARKQPAPPAERKPNTS